MKQGETEDGAPRRYDVETPSAEGVGRVVHAAAAGEYLLEASVRPNGHGFTVSLLFATEDDWRINEMMLTILEAADGELDRDASARIVAGLCEHWRACYHKLDQLEAASAEASYRDEGGNLPMETKQYWMYYGARESAYDAAQIAKNIDLKMEKGR